MITTDRLDQLLARIPDLRIAVVGDFFLDKYLVTDPALSEHSIETGLEARQVVEVRCSPGAAGTVTNNLAALGVGRIEAVSVVGDDGEGYELARGLSATGVRTKRLIMDRSQVTPTYMKPMVRESQGERELERLDIKNRGRLLPALESRIIAELEQLVDAAVRKADAVIVADQVQERNRGVITDNVRIALASLAENRKVTFLADSRVRIGEFRNVIIKPNKQEAARALHPDWSGDVTREQAAEFGRALAARNGKTVFLTMGEEGMLVCEPDPIHVPAVPVHGPVDIVGAGDSATAGIVCALCAGATPVEAGLVGNLCASVTVRKLATTGTASPQELRAALSTIPT